MLLRGAIFRQEADLREAVLEARGLGGLGIADVAFEVPVCALGDLADYEAAGDVGDPVAAWTVLVSVKPGMVGDMSYAKRSLSASVFRGCVVAILALLQG